MRIGVLARAEDRGIGIQTWEAFRHLPGASALIVDPGRFGQGFPLHTDRYMEPPGRDVRVVRWGDDQTFDETVVRGWLETVDVAYIVETAYDRRFYEWARDAGVATVLHTNPELHHIGEAIEATQVWIPTPWRAERVAFFSGARTPRLVPYPVALGRFPLPNGLYESPPLRVLHVGGRAAYGDRNGTKLVAAACRLLDPRLVEVTVASQDENPAIGPGALRMRPTVDYWSLYDGFHVLAMPRRFGGLCLPIQESKAAGLATVALDEPPSGYYEAVTIPADASSSFETGTGVVPILTANVSELADMLHHLATHPDVTRTLQLGARAWAIRHSWTANLERWLEELQNAWSCHLDT